MFRPHRNSAKWLDRWFVWCWRDHCGVFLLLTFVLSVICVVCVWPASVSLSLCVCVCVCVFEIDVLVNNAGRSQRAWVIDTALQVDRELINLNVLGSVSLTKCVLPHMVARRHGYILVNSSVIGKLRETPRYLMMQQFNNNNK